MQKRSLLLVLGIIIGLVSAWMPAQAFVIDYTRVIDESVLKEEKIDFERTIVVNVRVERGDTFSGLGKKLLGLNGVSGRSEWLAIEEWLTKTARLNRRTVDSLNTIRPGEVYLVPVTLAMLARLERGDTWMYWLRTYFERERQDSKVVSSLNELREAVGNLAGVLKESVDNLPRARTGEEIEEAIRKGVRSGLSEPSTDTTRSVLFWILFGLFCALLIAGVGALYAFMRYRARRIRENNRDITGDKPVVTDRVVQREETDAAYGRMQKDLDDLRAELKETKAWIVEHTPGYELEKTVDGVTQRFVLVAFRTDADGHAVRVFRSPYVKGVANEVFEHNLASHMRKNDPQLNKKEAA